MSQEIADQAIPTAVTVPSPIAEVETVEVVMKESPVASNNKRDTPPAEVVESGSNDSESATVDADCANADCKRPKLNEEETSEAVSAPTTEIQEGQEESKDNTAVESPLPIPEELDATDSIAESNAEAGKNQDAGNEEKLDLSTWDDLRVSPDPQTTAEAEKLAFVTEAPGSPAVVVPVATESGNVADDTTDASNPVSTETAATTDEVVSSSAAVAATTSDQAISSSTISN